jgi:hypothetical protein
VFITIRQHVHFGREKLFRMSTRLSTYSLSRRDAAMRALAPDSRPFSFAFLAVTEGGRLSTFLGNRRYHRRVPKNPPWYQIVDVIRSSLLVWAVNSEHEPADTIARYLVYVSKKHSHWHGCNVYGCVFSTYSSNRIVITLESVHKFCQCLSCRDGLR